MTPNLLLPSAQDFFQSDLGGALCQEWEHVVHRAGLQAAVSIHILLCPSEFQTESEVRDEGRGWLSPGYPLLVADSENSKSNLVLQVIKCVHSSRQENRTYLYEFITLIYNFSMQRPMVLFIFLPQALQMYVQVCRRYFMEVVLLKQSDKTFLNVHQFMIQKHQEVNKC